MHLRDSEIEKVDWILRVGSGKENPGHLPGRGRPVTEPQNVSFRSLLPQGFREGLSSKFMWAYGY